MEELTYSSDDSLLPGQVVLVPVGRRVVPGMVIKKVAQPDFATKKILQVLYSKPLPQHLLKTIGFIHDYYMVSSGSAVSLVLPRGVQKKRRKTEQMFGTMQDVAVSVFSSAGLENSETSYAGRPGEPPASRANLSASSGIYVPDFSNHFMLQKKQISGFTMPIAIGEVGLDYHYEGYDREAQIRLFEQMLQLATDNELPVSFHIREAFVDFFPVVANFPKVRGVVHSFTDSKKVLKRILNETPFYVGVNGLATYSTLPLPSLDKILLETDAPFLAPVPHRGETNEPTFVPDIAKWLAAKLDLSIQEVAKTTTQNTEALFDI